MPKLFLYDNLTNPKTQHDLFGRIFPMVSDSLEGYKKIELIVPGKNVITARVHAPSTLEGMVIEVTDDDIAKLQAQKPLFTKELLLLKSGEQAWVFLQREDNSN